MIKILKNSYKRFWVPVMGRLLSKLIPLIEGKPPTDLPTYKIDGDQNTIMGLPVRIIKEYIKIYKWKKKGWGRKGTT